MLFDAGHYGMVEVDKIIEKEDRRIGIKDFDRLRSATYINYGKEGCAKVTTVPPKSPANCGEAACAKTQQMINASCNRVLHNLQQRLAATDQEASI